MPDCRGSRSSSGSFNRPQRLNPNPNNLSLRNTIILMVVLTMMIVALTFILTLDMTMKMTTLMTRNPKPGPEFPNSRLKSHSLQSPKLLPERRYSTSIFYRYILPNIS